MADKANTNEKAKEAATGTTLESSVQDNTSAPTEPAPARTVPGRVVDPDFVVVEKVKPALPTRKLDEVPKDEKPRYQRDGRWVDPDGKDLGPVKEGE